MTDDVDLSIVVFAYNEAENIPPVLKELCGWLNSNVSLFEIVFIDDGSSDGTLDLAEKALDGIRHRCVRHDQRSGIGAALKTGVRHARGTWVTFMPADGQIPPDAIGSLMNQQQATQSNVVFSVYDRRDDGWLRKLLSWGVRTLILLLLGVRMRSDGPYLFLRTLFVPEKLPPDSFFLNFEFPIKMLRQKERCAEVTVGCRQRFAGVSKSANPGQAYAVAKDLLKLRMRMFRESA